MILFALVAVSASGWSLSVRIGELAIALVFAPLIWLGFRAARVGCRIEGGGVRVRNVLSERLLVWPDITGFSLGRSGVFPFVGRVHLVDGEVVPIFWIQAPNSSPRNRRTAALIERLQVELERRSGGADAS